MKGISFLFLFLLILSITNCKVEKNNIKIAGVRSSGYGVLPFPKNSGWEAAIKEINGYFDGPGPCGIAVLKITPIDFYYNAQPYVL